MSDFKRAITEGLHSTAMMAFPLLYRMNPCPHHFIRTLPQEPDAIRANLHTTDCEGWLDP